VLKNFGEERHREVRVSEGIDKEERRVIVPEPACELIDEPLGTGREILVTYFPSLLLGVDARQ
jgi:hypothetical protein